MYIHIITGKDSDGVGLCNVGASTASIPTPQELDPSEIDIDSKISVNRSPVMILWSAVVAREVLGYNWEEALSLAHAVSALNAQSKASRIWGNEKPNESAVSVDGPAVEGVVLLGRNVPACLQTQADGVRGCVSGSAIDPRAPSNRLKQAFPGPALSHVYSSMVHLARHVADAIRVNSRHAYTLYETFRPEIPDGPGGWGMCGLLSLSKILEPLGETWREDISAQRKESERTAGVGNRRKGVHDGQMQIKVEDDGNGVAAGTCVMMESFTGKHTDSQVKEENAEQAHTAQEEEEGQDGDACFTRGKQDRIGLVSQGRSVGEDATNCILAVIQSAGPEGVIEQVLQKEIGHVDAKDVRALVEEMQLDGLLYSKDGRLFLL